LNTRLRLRGGLVLVLPICLLAGCGGKPDAASSSGRPGATNETRFPVKGVVKELPPGGTTVVIGHEAIPGYMDAMTMPFRAKKLQELAGLQAGDEITFRLHVTSEKSWIDEVSRTGRHRLEANPAPAPHAANVRPLEVKHPLLDYPFTNELGRAVRLNDLRGQALALTFFFTRCPIPEYCPRLSKNFQEAARKLSSRPGAPTNWHFLSVSFDTEGDTPPVLKAYGQRYQYDPDHWSFLTGPSNKIAELAAFSDVEFKRDGFFFNHNFRTLIIDPAGHLQMVFPIGGDLSEAIAEEILKAAALTNR
jgi:protein SCO1